MELKAKLLNNYNHMLQERHDEQQSVVVDLDVQLKQVKEDLSNCRYCINCPHDNREYKNGLYAAFLQMGILNMEDPRERLLFVTDAEAAGYSCLAWDRFNSGIEGDRKYLVCNIGETACTFSEIIAHSTETKSEVRYIKDELEGTSTITHKYEKNLNNTTTDKEKIISMMRELPDKLRRLAFGIPEEEEAQENQQNMNDDRQIEALYNDYSIMVLDRLYMYSSELKVSRIFMVGRFCSEQIFWDEVDNSSAFRDTRDFLTLMADSPVHATSRGAVTFGLRVPDAQLPVFIKDTNPTYFADPPISTVDPKKYQYVVGIGQYCHGKKTETVIIQHTLYIDFGTTYSGVSYAASTASINDIHTIRKWQVVSLFQKQN